MWTLEKYEDLSPIILSVGEEDEVTIAQVAQMVADAMGYTEGLQFDTSKADGQYKKTASNKKLKSLNPDFQFTPIQKGKGGVFWSGKFTIIVVGIKQSVEWFVNNYETARK